jgi:glycosyltransferase involved in cell wall biosynthesis
MTDRVERVVVINDEAINTGGAAAVALESARLLRCRGVPVTLLAGEAEGALKLGDPGVDFVSLGGVHIMRGARAAAALRGLFDPRTRAALADWIARHDTPRTVYHLHNWHKVLSPSIFAALRPVAGRLFLHAHDYFLACPNGGYMHYPQSRPCGLSPMGARCLLTACDRRHYGHKLWRVARQSVRQHLFDLGDTAARILAVHEGMLPYLVRGGIAETGIRVLRNPVRPWRAARVPAEENSEIFFVGRLEPDKGIDLLAKAAKRAGAPLSVVGDGPLREALARDHPEARLCGWQPREALACLIVKARLLVLPSRWPETFGLVALEALMSGVPVVISALDLIADEIVRGGLGWSCDPYDEAALAAAIERLAHDDAIVAAASRRAFASARRLAPTPAEWCDKLLGLYEDALSAAGASAR